MNQDRTKRKLSAIVTADIVEYSRLTGDEDDATVHTLTRHREMMSTVIKQHQGRVVDCCQGSKRKDGPVAVLLVAAMPWNRLTAYSGKGR